MGRSYSKKNRQQMDHKNNDVVPKRHKKSEKTFKCEMNHDIRKQMGTTWSRKAQDRETWTQLKHEYAREATP